MQEQMKFKAQEIVAELVPRKLTNGGLALLKKERGSNI